MRGKIEAMWYGAAGPWWLLPLSFLYGTAMAVRSILYRLGLRHRVRMPVPVIVVGNLTVGGTGKTPLVAWLSIKLSEEGLRVGIVSRGYGGRASGVTRVTVHSDPIEVGDEPVLLARRAQATVFVGKDRVAAARAAIADHADVVICDDGLQHLALMRDAEIAVIDGQRGFGNGCLLPRGPLREAPRRLKRVTAVVINGAMTAQGFSLPKVQSLFTMQMAPADARAVSRNSNAVRSLASFRDSPVHAVAAIGNPARFFATLRAAGLTVQEHPMPDHHAFRAADLNFGDRSPVLMTEKDAVKCAAFGDDRVWFVPVTAEFAAPESQRLIDLVLARVKAFEKHG